MATIEALIRKRLLSRTELSEKLATFGGMPAIFFQETPDDKDESWGDAQYPRIVFSADTFADPARDRRKVMFVDIICSTTRTAPEEIEPLVREALTGVFFTPDVGETFSAKWRETQVFKEAVGVNHCLELRRFDEVVMHAIDFARSCCARGVRHAFDDVIQRPHRFGDEAGLAAPGRRRNNPQLTLHEFSFGLPG